MSTERRCLTIDSQPLIRAGVARVLDGFEVESVEAMSDGLELLAAVGGFDVAIAGFDGQQDGTDPRFWIRKLRQESPGLGIVAYSGCLDRRTATGVIDAGADAFVCKSSSLEVFERAVGAALESERFIDPALGEAEIHTRPTQRQGQVLQLYADGISTDEASAALGITAETVRTHAKGAIARLDANDRAHAIAIAMRAGLIH